MFWLYQNRDRMGFCSCHPKIWKRYDREAFSPTSYQYFSFLICFVFAHTPTLEADFESRWRKHPNHAPTDLDRISGLPLWNVLFVRRTWSANVSDEWLGLYC